MGHGQPDTAHPLGICDGCLQLDEADLGHPQLGLMLSVCPCRDTETCSGKLDVAVHVVQAWQLGLLGRDVDAILQA